MNNKQGKNLDHHIRQALDALPDEPPPDSAFDAGQLWERLRPELAVSVFPAQSIEKQPIDNQKRPVLFWWLAAASFIGLLISWLWRSGQDIPETNRARQDLTQKTELKTGSWAKANTHPNQEVVSARKPKTLITNTQPKQQRIRINKAETILVLAEHTPDMTVSPPELVADIPKDSATNIAENGPVSSGPVAVRKSALARAPKRQFQVVHVNELADDEEQGHLTESRPNRFFRLGTGSPASVGSGGESPKLQVNLGHKSTQ
jgi:hypothetical protein